jgi:hypothetical protein
MRLLLLDDLMASYTHGRHIAIPEKSVFRLISSIKGEGKKKHFGCGRSFSCFPAHVIERDLF